MRGMNEFCNKFFKKFISEETEEEKLIKNINNALCEMNYARNNFDMATGEDNIELAIYELSTAEIKYRNLLKEAKRLGILNRGFSSVIKEEVEENQCS